MRVALLSAWACVLALAAGAAPAQEDRVQAGAGVAYTSGGIGVASQEQLKAREKEFNLKLVFTLVEGNYLADVSVAVKDAAGKGVVEHLAEGPIFLARLPAGAYSVEVAYEGRLQARKVRVADRLRTEYFRWPSRPGVDYPLPPESRRER